MSDNTRFSLCVDCHFERCTVFEILIFDRFFEVSRVIWEDALFLKITFLDGFMNWVVSFESAHRIITFNFMAVSGTFFFKVIFYVLPYIAPTRR